MITKFRLVCFIPSPVRVGTLLRDVPGTPIGGSFFKFELKPTEKNSADPTHHEFQDHIFVDVMYNKRRLNHEQVKMAHMP